MSRKIVPFGGTFTDMRAMLAAIAEDPQAVGFVGCVLVNEGGVRVLRRVNFGLSISEVAMASLIMGELALERE